MTCFTCLTDHPYDEACARPAHPIDRPGDDLFDDADDASPVSGLGPVFTATYDGEDACCGEGIEVGQRIRADGAGGWIHEGCS